MSVPGWVLETAASLASSIAKLVTATNDADREDALMTAAEATKAALDRIKFPDG